MNAFADRVLSRPELVGHVLVDDDGNRFPGVILLVEEASTAEGDFHGFKIMASDDSLVGIEKLLTGKRHATLNGDRRPGKSLAQGERRDPTGRDRPRGMLESVP